MDHLILFQNTLNRKNVEKLLKKGKKKIAEKRYFTKSAGAKCDHLKLGVRTHVRAALNLDMRGACVRPKKRSQLTPCSLSIKRDSISGLWQLVTLSV